MSTLLVRDAEVLVTLDGARREIPGGGLFARDGVVEAVGPSDALPRRADEILDARGCVVTPGLISTHHHLFQTLTRAVPGATEATLFGWLKRLYPIWARLTPADIRLSAALGLAELALSGCTTASDHLYLFPNGARLDDSIEGAAETGLRFHPTRGAMSLGESAGGLPPDALTEAEPAILEDCLRVADAFHDPAPGAMLRIGIAPCSPFSVTPGLMRDAAALARARGLRLHTHLAENAEDVAFSEARFGRRPGAYAESLGWTGEDVWHAHCVALDPGEIALFARTGTAVAHCPGSNARLGCGIAPIRAMRDAGVAVGLGVDGSASNDAASLIGEARLSLLMQRAAGGPAAFAAREALELATLGGARALGRDDLGALAPGMRADLAVWDLGAAGLAGAWDPVAALVLCDPGPVRDLRVEGRRVVAEGRLVTCDHPRLIEAGRAAARGLAEG